MRIVFTREDFAFLHKFGDNLKKINFQKLHSEFNNSEKLQIFCIYSEDYLLDIIIRLIPKKN